MITLNFEPRITLAFWNCRFHHERHEAHEARSAQGFSGRMRIRESRNFRRGSWGEVFRKSARIGAIGGPLKRLFRTFSARGNGDAGAPGRRFALPWTVLWWTFSPGIVMEDLRHVHRHARLRHSAVSADERTSGCGFPARCIHYLPFVCFVNFVVRNS